MLRLQNTHYQHSPVQIYMLAFTEDVFYSNPSQGKAERVHTVLPAPTPQASQHHWDGAKLRTHQWKPESMHLNGWTQRSHFGARTWKSRRKTLGETLQLIILYLTIFHKNWGGTNIQRIISVCIFFFF